MRLARPVHDMREALVKATLPQPDGALPALANLDLAPFWLRFDQTAPAHLRAGLWAATTAFAALAPVALLRPVRLEQLRPSEWETVFRASCQLPLFAELVMLTKVVACLAYFDDDAVQDIVRAGGEA